MRPYCALRNHTPYSLLEGAIPISALLSQAVQYNMSSLGIADRGHVFGVLEFSLACQKKGLHPLIGCQLSCVHSVASSPYPVVFFAKSALGYQNLCRIVSASTVNQSPPLRGHVSWEQVTHYCEDLLLLSGGVDGPLDQLLAKNRPEQTELILQSMLDVFGDRFFMEIQREEAVIPEGHVDLAVSERRLSQESWLIDRAFDLGIPCVATNTALFLTPGDHEAQDALQCISAGRYMDEVDRPRTNPYRYFRSPKDMVALFQDLPEALENTHYVAQRCAFLLRSAPPSLPSFPCDKPEPEELVLQSQKGLDQRLMEEVYLLHPPSEHDRLRQEYQSRLDYECNMIVSMGFAGYFLIVSDFIRWAKSQSIPVGPGRGSGASSLVAWALSITDVDPIRFHLFFERFLNPERISMPDFDVDFCQERRDEVIHYVRQRYGQEHVAHIITFGTLQARAVLRDVGRVLQMPYPFVDKICKLVPHNPAQPKTLREALQLEPQLAKLRQEDEQVGRLMDIALKLEGLYRHASVHAAGVIISQKPLTDVVALYQDENTSVPATEFSMKYVESAGLVKFDFLGLKTLTVLQTAMHLLQKRNIIIDLPQIPLNDTKTFELLNRSETVGLFQLESAGMSDVLGQLQPTHFNEIIALVALYRPGPMDDIPRYLACRHGREQVTYAYPCLESILEETFGVMVYQEQVLQIARTLAGYTLGGADILRRAMGKKIQSEMDAQRIRFVTGVVETSSGDPAKASALFDQIAKFASYAFPKAHATPYALISYHTAYFKAHFPVEFMTALMIHDSHNVDKLRLLVQEAQRLGITILPPDINQSMSPFSVAGPHSIRYGLAALKGVGVGTMEKLVIERTANGPFSDIWDCVNRTIDGGVNKKNLESLIAAGAYDALHPKERATLWANVEPILHASSARDTAPTNTLFPVPKDKPTLKNAPPWSHYESLEYERLALGFYLTAHPLQDYPSDSLTLWNQISSSVITENASFVMMGMVLELIEKISKSGKKYAFLLLSDPTGSYEVTLFSDLLAQHRTLLAPGTAVALKVTGRVLTDAIRLSAQAIFPIEHYLHESYLVLRIAFKDIIHLQRMLVSAEAGQTSIHVMTTIMSPDQVSYKVIVKLPKAYRMTPKLRSGLAPWLNPSPGGNPPKPSHARSWDTTPPHNTPDISGYDLGGDLLLEDMPTLSDDPPPPLSF